MADRRIVIESVQIKNFRSIRNETLQVKDFNIFVGLNDAGKSNFLKAMNLFFNGQTDYNTAFDFRKDFTYLFPATSHSTKEIKITVKFLIPETYKEKGIYTWVKIWRTDDYNKETITNSYGEEPTARSRVPSTLKRIRYRYVPAVKSADYYRTLLADLYSTVSSSLNNPLHSSTQAFSDMLRDYTNTLSSNVLERLNMKSELSIPSNLSDIFRALVFMTKMDDKGISVPLNSRGDGIQARHIPIILKYIAEEDKKSRNQGSMKITSIWGYEEPENGLEISRAFEISDEFSDYSKEIQIFTSTHSPAFYMKKKDDNTEVYYVNKNHDTEETTFTNEKNIKSISQNMGLMPLIAPFIAEQEEKLKKIEFILSDNFLTDIDTIVVEGKTDREYLKSAIKIHSACLDQMIIGGTLRILTKDEGCGTTQLHDWALAWTYSGFKNKLFILFDRDEAGRKAKSDIESNAVFKTRNSNRGSISTQFIEPSDSILEVLDKKVEFSYEIEHLLSIGFWKVLKTKNLVEMRSDKEMREMFVSQLPRAKTIDNIIEELIENVDIRDTIVTYNINEKKKVKANEFVNKTLEKEEGTILFAGFKRTIEKIERAFLKV